MTVIDRPSAQYLTHKYASFHGCTLGEMAIILGVWSLIEFPFLMGLSIWLGRYLGGFFGALLLLLLLFAAFTFFVLLKVTAKRIGALRKGRAAGYLSLQTRQWLHRYFGIQPPFVYRLGTWSTQRREG